MISQISAAELPALGACAAEFYRTSKHLHAFSMERFCEIWRPLLEQDAGVIFADECDGQIVGTLGGILHRDPYGHDLVAAEMFWFVREAARGAGPRLYWQFEEWAIRRGAARMQMVHLLDVMPDKVARFYRRVGFAPIETRYSKDLA